MNRILTRLRTLQQRFYNRSGFFQTRDGIRNLPGKFQHSLLVLGRGLCMYRYQDFSNVPKNKRESALESALGLWSPFEQTGWYCHWHAGFAMVWFWDKSGIDYEALPTQNFRVIPETVLSNRSRNGCVRQQCESGVELQYWNNSVLVDSLWIAGEPDSRQVSKFCSRHSESPDLVVQPANGTFQVWHRELGPIEWIQHYEKHLVSVAIVLFGVLFIWQEVRIFRAQLQEGVAETRLLDLEEELAPLLAARNKIDRLVQRNNSTLRLASIPSQARLMTLVSRVLPSQLALFREWHYQQGALSFTVEDPEAKTNAIDYVTALRTEPFFIDVSAEQARGNNRFQISLRVVQ